MVMTDVFADLDQYDELPDEEGFKKGLRNQKIGALELMTSSKILGIK